MARAFAPASSQYISLSTSDLTLHNLTAATIFARFRSTNAGTTRIVIYDEDTNGNSGMFVALNDTVAGRLRAFRRDSNGNAADLIYDGSYNDGNWHSVVFAWASASSYELFIDGISRDTDSTNLSGAKTISSRAIGRRFTSTASGYFDGEIAEVAGWGGALVVADALMLAKGFSPLVVQPELLRFYAPLIGKYSPEIDIVGGLSLTLSASAPTTADHPPVRHPSVPMFR